jgi:hypothetical protein
LGAALVGENEAAAGVNVAVYGPGLMGGAAGHRCVEWCLAQIVVMWPTPLVEAVKLLYHFVEYFDPELRGQVEELRARLATLSVSRGMAIQGESSCPSN